MGREPQVAESQLLPIVLKNLQARNSSLVYDLGIAAPKTIRYFSSSDCRIFYADVFGEMKGVVSENEIFPLAILPTDEFDICFFWDYLNLISDGIIQALATSLTHHVSSKTLVHGFLAHSTNVNMPARKYAIESDDTLAVSPFPNYPNTPKPRTRTDLARYFPSIDIRGIRLSKDNRDEFYGTF